MNNLVPMAQYAEVLPMRCESRQDVIRLARICLFELAKIDLLIDEAIARIEKKYPNGEPYVPYSE